jgi:prepilin-type N-terminal cleavage/methylation domain-containing protein
MSQNSLSVRGFTLVELIVAISVGMFIITGIMRALISLSDNTQVVDDGFTTMENREMFKRDMIAVKKEYPTIIINT